MRRKRWNPLYGGAMAGMLLLAGCQPVGNVDVNQLFTSSLSVKSMEGSQLIQLEMVQDPSDSITSDQKLFYDLMGHIKLHITETKMKDPLNSSMKGTFEYKNGAIPFQLTVTNQKDLTLWVEGAKKPIVFRNSMPAMQQGSDMVSKHVIAQMEQLQQRAVEAAPQLVSFFITHAPNPRTITVAETKETIQGETLSLHKIHAEIYGNELLELVKGFLTNMLADDKSMKEFIGVLYDLYAPLMQEMMKEQEGQSEPSALAQSIMPFLKNKTLAVEFLHTLLKEQLGTMLAQYDTAVTQMMSSGSGGQAHHMLSEQQSLKVDLYADRDMMIRKSNTEVVLTMPEEDTSGLKHIKITAAGENWNLNKPVTLTPVDISGGVTDITQSPSGLNPSKLVASLEPTSALYKLLKQDLKITKKDIHLSMDDEALLPAEMKPFNDEGTVMVPLRYVSEQLDADVEWNDSLKQVTITDPLTSGKLVLTIGSKQATWNGSPRSLEKAAILVEGSTFVPIRFVSEALGAKVEWDQQLNLVKITRE